jgi:hypothetical protein
MSVAVVAVPEASDTIGSCAAKTNAPRPIHRRVFLVIIELNSPLSKVEARLGTHPRWCYIRS